MHPTQRTNNHSNNINNNINNINCYCGININNNINNNYYIGHRPNVFTGVVLTDKFKMSSFFPFTSDC